MDWLASIISVCAKIPATRKWWFAPILGVVANGYWLWYEWQIEQYGLMPMSLVIVNVIVVPIRVKPMWAKLGKPSIM